MHGQRQELLDLCTGSFLSKSGNMDTLRQRLVCHWMSKASPGELKLWSEGIPSPTALEHTSSAAPPLSETASSAAPVAAEPAASSAGPASSAAPAAQASSSSAAPAAEVVAGQTSSPGATLAPATADPCQSVLSQCLMASNKVKDVSEMFTDLSQGPQIDPSEKEVKNAELIAAADVVMPVAGMVKILQALHEEGSNVALLLAGRGLAYVPLSMSRYRCIGSCTLKFIVDENSVDVSLVEF